HADLARTAARHVDVVVAVRHLVGRLRELEHRRRDPARAVPREGRRDEHAASQSYKAKAAATSTPPANAISSRSIRASQRWASTVSGFATTIVPKDRLPTNSGRATASNLVLASGGWKTKSLSACRLTRRWSAAFGSGRKRAGFCPGNGSSP